jgi:hypothetical protein
MSMLEQWHKQELSRLETTRGHGAGWFIVRDPDPFTTGNGYRRLAGPFATREAAMETLQIVDRGDAFRGGKWKATGSCIVIKGIDRPPADGGER